MLYHVSKSSAQGRQMCEGVDKVREWIVHQLPCCTCHDSTSLPVKTKSRLCASGMDLLLRWAEKWTWSAGMTSAKLLQARTYVCGNQVIHYIFIWECLWYIVYV